VIAVEPAIFIPGWGGIHLEDNILITKDGCENFTTTEKRLIEL
ncbi:MAG: aminopeptidase P family protein, partial [Dorea sp.]|nr:aminopeptidase P family protein [Dorea sp.]